MQTFLFRFKFEGEKLIILGVAWLTLKWLWKENFLNRIFSTAGKWNQRVHHAVYICSKVFPGYRIACTLHARNYWRDSWQCCTDKNQGKTVYNNITYVNMNMHVRNAARVSNFCIIVYPRGAHWIGKAKFLICKKSLSWLFLNYIVI